MRVVYSVTARLDSDSPIEACIARGSRLPSRRHRSRLSRASAPRYPVKPAAAELSPPPSREASSAERSGLSAPASAGPRAAERFVAAVELRRNEAEGSCFVVSTRWSRLRRPRDTYPTAASPKTRPPHQSRWSQPTPPARRHPRWSGDTPSSGPGDLSSVPSQISIYK